MAVAVVRAVGETEGSVKERGGRVEADVKVVARFAVQ